MCKTDEEIKLLPFSEIIYLKGEGKKTIIYSKKHLPITLKKNLNAVSQNLPENFYRIHKSYITRIEYIESVQLKPLSVAVLKNKENIPISKRIKNFLAFTYATK
ncbi:MAG: LytTR family transcriptional regulator DNA-binding domain-containing protein [Leptospiraceae bacterium]|nr:LytTR family transcriptional regulator DNA-binding domain-containing protein [Leptospiraceae bacterium]